MQTNVCLQAGSSSSGQKPRERSGRLWWYRYWTTRYGLGYQRYFTLGRTRRTGILRSITGGRL